MMFLHWCKNIMASQKNKRNVLRDSQESGLFRNILSFANLKQTNGFYNFLTILSYKLLFAACYRIWHELSFFCKKRFLIVIWTIFLCIICFVGRIPGKLMITILRYKRIPILCRLYNFHLFSFFDNFSRLTNMIGLP